MSRPMFLDEQVGEDGKRWYSIKDNEGKVLYPKVLLEKNYLKLVDGTKISSNIMVNLLTIDNIQNYKGVKATTTFGNQIITTLIDTENGNDLILKSTTTFGTAISEKIEYFQKGVVLYSFTRTTSFGNEITTTTV